MRARYTPPSLDTSRLTPTDAGWAAEASTLGLNVMSKVYVVDGVTYNFNCTCRDEHGDLLLWLYVSTTARQLVIFND